MISPSFGRSALHAVITRSLGSDRGSTTREWYRMPVTGLGIPSNSSSSSWITSRLPVHEPVGSHHARAECLADRLVAETHAQDRYLPGQRLDQRHQDTGFPRRARAGREHGRRGLEGEHLLYGQRVVAVHHRLRAELAEQLDEVVGERVVVVEDEEHVRI